MFEEGIHSYPTICSSLHITYLPKMPDQLYTRMSSRSLMQALPRASEYMHSIAIPALSLCLYSLCMHTPRPHILSLSLSLSLSVHIPTQVAGRKGFPHVIYVCEDFALARSPQEWTPPCQVLPICLWPEVWQCVCEPIPLWENSGTRCVCMSGCLLQPAWCSLGLGYMYSVTLHLVWCLRW